MVRGQRVVVGIEAKADESFGPVIGEYLAQREQFNDTRTQVPNSGVSAPRLSQVPARIRALCRYVFGRDLDDQIGALRYQLLHAVAGTMREAEQREADVAVFLVHEFDGPSCHDENIAGNANDFAAFVRQLGLDWPEAGERIVGPVSVTAGERPIQLWVGKVTSRIGASAE